LYINRNKNSTRSIQMAHPNPAHGLVRAIARPVYLLAAAALIFGGCGKSDGTQAPPAAARQALPVTLLTAQPTSAPLMIEAIGQTEGAREVEVRARVGGILEKRLYQEGSPVKPGQALFRIERAPYEIALAQARAQLAEAQARAKQAAREEERLKGLLDQQAISRKEYDDATSSLAVNKAAVLAAEAAARDAQLNLSYTTVTAPVAGISGREQKSEGALLTIADGLLTSIVQLDPIRVRFSLAEAELAQFPGGKAQAAKAVRLVLADGSVHEAPGRLDFTASRVDPALGTLELRAEFPNRKHDVLPGQFVRVQVQARERDNVFRVPQAAVVQAAEGPTLMLMNADGKVEPRAVSTGEWAGTDWIVTGGLNAGDKVIVDNLIKLRPGMPVMDKASLPPAGGSAAAGAKG
jgi:membrane fusion protein (multidrug efflux system)